VPFLHSVRDIVIRDKARSNVVQGTQKRHMFKKRHQPKPENINDKDPMLKEAITSEEVEHIRQDLQGAGNEKRGYQ
jgi:hypothetical protein